MIDKYLNYVKIYHVVSITDEIEQYNTKLYENEEKRKKWR